MINGLSVSGLELWLVDRVAFECSYLRDLEAVEPWNKNMQFGTLVQAGIEGYIKTRQARGAGKLIANEFEKQIALYSETDEISFWTKLATQMVNTWISLYAKDLDTYGIKHSERHHEMMLELPSGRSIKLHGYVDGEGDDALMENKCRGEWDETKLAEEIDLNLQVNMYCLFHKAQHGKLPSTVWYQHMRRPAGFAYRGPARRSKETDKEFALRLCEAIDGNRPYHFFRYFINPDEQRFNRFLHACLYPMLECFLDWYEYMALPSKQGVVNKTHFMMPYGLYNPFMEGTAERFRNFRMSGSTFGLRKKSR